MKRSDLEKANRLHQQLAEIEASMAAVEAERDADQRNYLGITLAGRYQDKAFVDACRDSVLSELRRQARKIEADLGDIGVWDIGD